MSLIRTFRIVALVEATSFLVLLGAMAVKYDVFADGGSDAGVKIMGPVHGGLFLLYVAMALLVAWKVRWSILTTLLVLLGAVVPFGGFAVDRWLAKNPQPKPA